VNDPALNPEFRQETVDLIFIDCGDDALLLMTCPHRYDNRRAKSAAGWSPGDTRIAFRARAPQPWVDDRGISWIERLATNQLSR
jgi:hypothetical protein